MAAKKSSGGFMPKAPAKGSSKSMPKGFEKSGYDNDKGVKEGSKADIARDLAEGLAYKKAQKKGKK